MKSKLTLLSSFRLWLVVACLSLFQYSAKAVCAWYVVDNIPWSWTGSNSNVDAMNLVYGVGGWSQGNFSTPAATIFAPTSCMVFLEGGDNNALALNTFLIANMTTIENWVNAGGRLFINAAPNQGGNINLGFGGTVLNYGPNFNSSGSAINPNHPVMLGPYLPTAPSYTGNYYGHAEITGTGLDDILQGDAPGHIVLADKLWGAGIAFFGGLTQPYFWTPNPQGFNLWYNIIYYVGNISLQTLNTTIPLNSYCGGQSFTLSYNTTGLTFVGGNHFIVQLSDATGSFATPDTIGDLISAANSGTITCTIDPTTITGTGYRIRTLSTNAAFTGANNGTDINITTPVYPTVDVTASPGNAICTNANTTFTATYTGGGPTPDFQWYKDNLPVGTNSPTYSDNNLADGDIVYVVMSSSAVCATPVNIQSNVITMTVADPSTPNVIVTASPTDTICSGTSVTFNTLVANAGPTPTYQWTKNGNPVGSNLPTYTDNTLADGDLVTCTMTSSAACVTPTTVTSNTRTVKLITSGFLAGNINYPTLQPVVMAGYKYQVSDPECNLIATVNPVGASPIHGNTNVSVSLTFAENTFNGQPYLKRHYDITPDSNEENATAEITLYAYQSEFNSYNVLANGWGFPLMPTSDADVLRIPNIRVTQFHGLGNVPANYPGPIVVITPTSVTWDATYHWWAITFPVSGFSGFYIHTSNTDNPLSVSNTAGSDFAFHAYPNPVEKMLSVNVNGTRTGDSYISLTDATGKLIQKVKLTSGSTEIDMSSMASGLYLIKYNDDARSETIKVTKQ